MGACSYSPEDSTGEKKLSGVINKDLEKDEDNASSIKKILF